MDLPKEKQFHFVDHTSAKNLNELMDKIQGMSYSEFYGHVNSTKNDFASWIRYVLKDESLADALDKVTSIVETLEILNDYIHPKARNKINSDEDIDGSNEFDGTKDIDMQSRIEHDILEIPDFPENEIPNLDDLESKKISENKVDYETNKKVIDKNLNDINIESNITKNINNDNINVNTGVNNNGVINNGANTKHSITGTSDDVGRLIVKDFVYGMIIGLIIGLILGRLITFTL